MLIKYLGNNERIICNIDGLDYTFKNSHTDESYIALNLIKGKHILHLKRKTLYNLLFCYLNIFNPIFYIWEIMFLEHREEEFKKSFSIFEIEFELLSQKAPYIILDFNSVIRYDDLVINSRKQTADILLKKRFKITVIGSSILFMLFFNILSILNYLQSNFNLSVAAIFCVLITFFSIKNIILAVNITK